MPKVSHAYKILVGKFQGRPRLRRANNIKINFQALICKEINWIIVVAQESDQWQALINARLNLRS